MKGLKYILLALAVLSFSDSSAQRRRNHKKVEKIDTVSIDSFSYAIGMANTQGLQNYLISKMNVDPACMNNFMEGFSSTLPAEDIKRLQAYCAGYQIRRQVEEQIIPELNKRIAEADSTAIINPQLFIEGFGEALAGHSSTMNLNKANEIAERQMEYYSQVSLERKYGENREAGEEFLESNAKKKDIKTLPGGVQYRILKNGTGAVPTKTSRVKVHYEGRLIDGTVFDSSYSREKPASFNCSQVIKGWTEALTHMPVGSKWEIFIPQELAYGAHESGKIPPFSALIFTVDLLEIEK